MNIYVTYSLSLLTLCIYTTHVQAVTSIMEVKNASDETLLVVPIPEDAPPFVLFTVPTMKPPAGFQGTYKATAGTATIPNAIKTIFFLKASILDDFEAFISKKKADYANFRSATNSTGIPNWAYSIENEFLQNYPSSKWAKFDWNKVVYGYSNAKEVQVPLFAMDTYGGGLNVTVSGGLGGGTIKTYL